MAPRDVGDVGGCHSERKSIDTAPTPENGTNN
jgi:hypothetical protein